MGAERAKAIVPEEMQGTAEAFSYSPGISCGEWVFVSGQVGRNSLGEVVRDPESQFVVAFENLGTVLREAGLSFGHVVDLTTYHTTFEHFPLFAEIKNRYLSEAPHPAWTGVGVSALALPGLLVEIKAIAQR